MIVFSFGNLEDVGKWLLSLEADEIRRSLSQRVQKDRKYHEGKAFAYGDIGRMLQKGEIKLDSTSKPIGYTVPPPTH